jgi:AcrR family transcriptional regulator
MTQLQSQLTNITPPGPIIAGSRVERRRARVRETILAAAETVFTREGGDALSMRRLADLLDVSPASIYKYFSSKEDLLAALKEQFFERLVERIEEASAVECATELTSEDRFQGMIRVYVETAAERPHHYMAAFSEIGFERDDRIQPGSAKFQARQVLLSTLSEEMERGVLRRDDPDRLTSLVWASMHGLTLLMIQIPGFGTDACDSSGDALSDPIEAMAALLWRGIKA